jgi:hypothetical protein
VAWVDLSVKDATRLRDFYAAVTGWTAAEVPMSGYSDYLMKPPGSRQGAAGICHARGEKADLPAQWLVYVTVASLAASLRRCRALGGEVLTRPRSMGGFGRFAVIRDPAGAVAALIEPPL